MRSAGPSHRATGAGIDDLLLRPPARSLAIQLVLAALVVLLAGSGAKACSEFAVDQSAPLLILTLGVVVAAVVAGLPGGIAALLFSLGMVLLIRDDVAPGLNDSRFVMVAAAFTGAGLTAATAYGMAERAYRRTARERDRASDLATELAKAVAAKDEFLGSFPTKCGHR